MKKYLKWVTLLFVSLISGGVLYFNRSDLFHNPSPLVVKEIQTNAIDDINAPQDVIVFSDNSTLKDIGYDVVLVGTLKPAKSRPVFLFKGYSCRACEPTVSLWIYNSQQNIAESFPFPGNHFLISEDKEKSEILNYTIEAIFGYCVEAHPSVVMAEKRRDEVSDQWNYLRTTIIFTDSGASTVTHLNENSFDLLKTLVREDCQKLEPEDRTDYL